MRAFARWLLTLFRPQPPPVIGVSLIDKDTVREFLEGNPNALSDALRACRDALNDRDRRRL